MLYISEILVGSSGWLVEVAAFLNRLGSDTLRLLFCLVLASVVAGLAIDRLGVWLGLLTVFGSFFLTWSAYNTLTGSTIPLIGDEKSLGEFWAMGTSSPWATLAFIFAFFAGVGAFAAVVHGPEGVVRRIAHVITGIFVGLSAWWSFMFFYYVVFVQWLCV